MSTKDKEDEAQYDSMRTAKLSPTQQFNYWLAVAVLKKRLTAKDLRILDLERQVCALSIPKKRAGKRGAK